MSASVLLKKGWQSSRSPETERFHWVSAVQQTAQRLAGLGGVVFVLAGSNSSRSRLIWGSPMTVLANPSARCRAPELILPVPAAALRRPSDLWGLRRGNLLRQSSQPPSAGEVARWGVRCPSLVAAILFARVTLIAPVHP